MASCGVSWRPGRQGSVLRRLEGIGPEDKGKSTLETPPIISQCLAAAVELVMAVAVAVTAAAAVAVAVDVGFAAMA